MPQIIRTNASNPDFIQLVKQLDAYLAITDGDDHAFYNQYNGLEAIKYVIVIYEHQTPIACGAIKAFDEESMEVKRMFTHPDYRGKGIATKVLTALENWARELHYNRCVLETGKRQVEAVQFYHKAKYQQVPNYGQYIGMDNSVCFEKILSS